MRAAEDVIVFEGDSLTYNGRLHELTTHFSSETSLYNVATGGNTIEQMMAQAATEVDPLLLEGGSNRLFLWAGMNNLLDGRVQTPYDAYNLLVSYVQARKAAGWDVTISTLPVSEGLADTDEIILYNRLIRENWQSFADELIDIGADPRFQNPDGTYFTSDDLHLNRAGNEIVADYIDALYYPAAPSSQGLVYYDAGTVTAFEVGQQTGFVSVGGHYADGSAIEGAITFLGGITGRVTYNNLGEASYADINGDGVLDILSVGGSYRSGAAIDGAVWYELDGSMHRFSYFNAGDYTLADWNGDGQLDLITNNAYDSGAQVKGAAWYNQSGAVQRIAHFDLGDYRVVDWDGDGQMEILSNMGKYSGGASLGGMVLVENNGSLSRLHYFDAGEGYEVVDLDGNGTLEVFSAHAKYGSGADAGALWFDQAGGAHRFTYNTLGNYQLADVTGDGDMEVISTGDRYSPSAAVGGTMLYDSNGAATRLNYYEMDDYQLVDFDHDGVLELLSGTVKYSSGAYVGGLAMFELSGDHTQTLIRLAYGDFTDFQVADYEGDGLLDVLQQTDTRVDVHFDLQALLA